MTCALFGSLCLDSAATEGRAVSDLFAFLLRWRRTHCVWTNAAGVHPPAGRNQKIRSRQFVLAALSYNVPGLDSLERNKKTGSWCEHKDTQSLRTGTVQMHMHEHRHGAPTSLCLFVEDSPDRQTAAYKVLLKSSSKICDCLLDCKYHRTI